MSNKDNNTSGADAQAVSIINMLKAKASSKKKVDTRTYTLMVPTADSVSDVYLPDQAVKLASCFLMHAAEHGGTVVLSGPEVEALVDGIDDLTASQTNLRIWRYYRATLRDAGFVSYVK